MTQEDPEELGVVWFICLNGSLSNKPVGIFLCPL